MNPTLTIPVILGPTASGKTSVGIELAKLIDGEIISVDSRKVYKGLSIGTAVPEGAWAEGAYVVKGIPHHLIGHLAPDEPYTAGDFAKDAEKLIQDILRRGKTPVLVGGTGFYFKALEKGLPGVPQGNLAMRDRLFKRLKHEGLSVLYAELKSLDPKAAAGIQPNDKQKTMRALEVYYLSGKPFSSWKEEIVQPSAHHFAVMGLLFSKPLLEKRIEDRSKRMEERGMIEEAAALIKQGYSRDCPALASFGYKEAVQVIFNELPRHEFLPQLIHGTKSYAKRQRTWFRTQVSPKWFECDEESRKEEIALKMRAFLETLAT